MELRKREAILYWKIGMVRRLRFEDANECNGHYTHESDHK
jgi:hypothetical protein